MPKAYGHDPMDRVLLNDGSAVVMARDEIFARTVFVLKDDMFQRVPMVRPSGV